MQTNSFVDWIACTIMQPSAGVNDCAEWGGAITFTNPNEWKESKARNGYKWAASHPDGFEVMCGRPDMGTHFIAPGGSLARAKGMASSHSYLIDNLMSWQGKMTRLDLALDVSGSGLEIDDLARDIELGNVQGTARKWNYVTAPNGGQCLYIGSRTSENFIRIYNKAAEQAARIGIPLREDWKRIELETKGVFARAAADRLHGRASVATTTAVFVRAVVDFPHNPCWSNIFDGVAIPQARSHRTLHNTERWLLGTVAKSLALRISIDPSFKRRFEAAVKGFLDDKNRP